MPRAAVDAAFEDEGPLARAIPQFEARRGQRRMARAVADALADGGTLLVEAGTGTGKTMGYLVPAILSGERVLVSTGTKTLQEQIYFKDLPALASALPVPFTATYMKGRSNYLCLHRLDQVRSAAPGGPFERLAAWAVTSDTGDRAELDDLPDDSTIWNDVAAHAETCLGTECPQYRECFVTRMRQRAAESDIVVVNHHLLCADAAVRQSSYGEVIPEFTRLVVDEAHQLEDVATQYFGISVSNYRVDELTRDVQRLLQRGDASDTNDSIRDAVGRVADHARAFFAALATARRSRPGSGGGRGGLEFGARLGDERLRITAEWFGDMVQQGVAMVNALDGLEAVLRLAGHAAGADDDVVALGERAGTMRDHLTFLLSAADASFVYFVELRGRGVFLRAAPVDVSAIVNEHIFGRMRTTVLTSATLAIAGSFEHVRRRLGVEAAEELSVPSEFDFARQSLLYLPRRMPSPKAPDYGDAVAIQVAEILRRTSGRAFVLFTSYAMMRTVYEDLLHALTFPLLLQGTAPRSVLLTQFRSTPNAVLLATSSFWQGVDVVGEQLSCVIIDKLPFASPGDPITAARIEAMTAAGGDAFNGYQVPLAILTLLQGLGRLIRHRDDRGILAVLDPRLRTMGYGRTFLEALPPSPVTQDLDDIARFFV